MDLVYSILSPRMDADKTRQVRYGLQSHALWNRFVQVRESMEAGSMEEAGIWS
jgi:hypothetical protein